MGASSGSRWSGSGEPLVIPEGADRQHTTYVRQWLTPQGVQLLRSRIHDIDHSSYTLVADLLSRLPASAWKDRAIRPYIPSHYCVAWDRAAPDPAKLPFPARNLLAQLLPSWSRTASGTLTTNQAQALLAAFARARLKFYRDHSSVGGIDWIVPSKKSVPRYTLVWFQPGRPNGSCGP